MLCVVRERSASGSSFFQWSPTDCGVPECDRETSIMRSWPTRGCRAMEKKNPTLGIALVFKRMTSCMSRQLTDKLQSVDRGRRAITGKLQYAERMNRVVRGNLQSADQMR